MTATITTPEKQDVDNPTRMVHRAYLVTPYVALCGAKVKGNWRPGSPVECVVCAEIDRNLG